MTWTQMNGQQTGQMSVGHTHTHSVSLFLIFSYAIVNVTESRVSESEKKRVVRDIDGGSNYFTSSSRW